MDRFRLRLLLTNSILPLAFAMIGMLLLTLKPPPESIWRWCSGLAVLCQVPFAIVNLTTARKFTPFQFKGVSRVLFFPFFAIGSMSILLQIWNLAVLNWFWPFFTGIVIDLIAAMLQFMRLVLRPEEQQKN